MGARYEYGLFGQSAQSLPVYQGQSPISTGMLFIGNELVLRWS
jgi:hypothetical protein